MIELRLDGCYDETFFFRTEHTSYIDIAMDIDTNFIDFVCNAFVVMTDILDAAMKT